MHRHLRHRRCYNRTNSHHTHPPLPNHGPQPQLITPTSKNARRPWSTAPSHVRKGLTYIEHELSLNSAIEHTAVEIVTGRKKAKASLYIINIYRNPKQYQQRFRTLLHRADHLAQEEAILLCGDFNAPHTAWGYPKTTAKGHSLFDETTEAGYQLLNDPAIHTRHGTSVQRDTNPDLTFYKAPKDRTRATWRNTGETLGSDHCILEALVPLKNRVPTPRAQQLTDWQQYRRHFDASLPPTIEDIDDWTRALHSATHEATALISIDADAPLADSRLAHLTEARASIRARWKRQRHNRSLRKRLAQLNREIEAHSATLCRQHWHAICQEADGQMHKSRTCHPPDPLPDYVGAPNPGLDADIEEWEVRAALQKLNCRSAAGPDKVTNKALRNMTDGAISALTAYYNKCWESGKLPPQWKKARTTLIPKPGKPTHIDHLRPISLTSCLGKLLEHVLLNRWQSYLEEADLYPDTLLGFRTKLSTQDAMLLIQHEILNPPAGSLDNYALLGLDLQSAFDKVHHSAILAQVSHLNMGHRTFVYVKVFLTNRTTQIVAGDVELPEKTLGSTGTPQGSVISPYCLT
ncbi:uncharacterized protein LOC144168228 [Haemaphysalis longicornis]